jgi:hypothetical protein
MDRSRADEASRRGTFVGGKHSMMCFSEWLGSATSANGMHIRFNLLSGSRAVVAQSRIC